MLVVVLVGMYFFIDNMIHYKVKLQVPVFLILSYIILLGIYLLYSKRFFSDITVNTMKRSCASLDQFLKVYRFVES